MPVAVHNRISAHVGERIWRAMHGKLQRSRMAPEEFEQEWYGAS